MPKHVLSCIFPRGNQCVHTCRNMSICSRPLHFCSCNLMTFSDGSSRCFSHQIWQQPQHYIWPLGSPHNWQKLYNATFHCQTLNDSSNSLKPVEFYHSSLVSELLDLFIRRVTVCDSWKQIWEQGLKLKRKTRLGQNPVHSWTAYGQWAKMES